MEWSVVSASIALMAIATGCDSPAVPPILEMAPPPTEPQEDCQSLAQDALPNCEPLAEPAHGTTSADGYLAVDDMHTYLAQGNGTISVLPRSDFGSPTSGEPEQLLASTTHTVELAIDATNVYSTGDTLVSVSKQGGPETKLFDGSTTAVAVGDDGLVYFTTSTPGTASELWRWSPSGSAARVTKLFSESFQGRLLVADGFAYLLDLSAGDAHLVRVDTTSGNDDELVVGIDVARGFARSGNFLYFTEEDGHDVKRVAIDGSGLVTLATFLGDPQKLDTDGSRLYLTLLDADPVAHAVSARLVRLAMDGTDACVLRCAAPYGAPNATYLILNQSDVFD